MRVLFGVQRDRQHLFPLPLACRAAGHEVRIAGLPVPADVIVHTGLPAVVVGTDHPIAFARGWRPDVTVHDIAGFAGAVSVREFVAARGAHEMKPEECSELLGRSLSEVRS